MTSIYDVPYEDIEEFLLFNNINFENKNDAYDKALILLKDKNAKGHTTSIIEWLMAYNLLIRKVNIAIYSIFEIDNMSQIKINQLAKLLTMKGNNINNIKNILKYLHKLDDETLLPDINDVILQNLNELEINEINFETLNPNDVINLLKTHRNKALIRKPIYNNLEKIIIYNFINIDIKRLNNLEYISNLRLPIYIILKLIENNEKRLLKNHTIEEINNLIDLLTLEREIENPFVYANINNVMKSLIDFIIDLIKINEIVLAKKVFDIAYNGRFAGIINRKRYSFKEYLIEILSHQKDNYYLFDTLLNFIGEDNFITDLDNINATHHLNNFSVYKILNILVKLEKYELLINVLNLLSVRNFYGNRDVINMMLPLIKKAIESKNNNLTMKYFNKLKLGLNKYQEILTK